MDAREVKPGIWNERLAAALLGVLVVVGLWQGYGAWLWRGFRAG
jgi:hypothetical protein